jgi:hypothetical protein
VIRVPGYRSRGPGFYSLIYYVFRGVIFGKRGPFSLVWIIGKLIERKINACGLENRI